MSVRVCHRFDRAKQALHSLFRQCVPVRPAAPPAQPRHSLRESIAGLRNKTAMYMRAGYERGIQKIKSASSVCCLSLASKTGLEARTQLSATTHRPTRQLFMKHAACTCVQIPVRKRLHQTCPNHSTPQQRHHSQKRLIMRAVQLQSLDASQMSEHS